MPIDLSQFNIGPLHCLPSPKPDLFVARGSLRVGWVAQFRDGRTALEPPVICDGGQYCRCVIVQV